MLLQIHFSKDKHMAKKYMKRCSTSFVIRELEIKTTKRYYFTLTKMAKIKWQTIVRMWRN